MFCIKKKRMNFVWRMYLAEAVNMNNCLILSSYLTLQRSHSSLCVCSSASHRHSLLVYRASCTRSLVFQVWQSHRKFPSSISIFSSQPLRTRQGQECQSSTDQKKRTCPLMLTSVYIILVYPVWLCAGVFSHLWSPIKILKHRSAVVRDTDLMQF